MSKKRIFSSWGIEHIVLKGNNKMTIFNSPEDCNFFLNLLRSKQEASTILISYVLMKNHVHLILKERDPQKISKLIMKVAGHYAKWYNEKYHRQNALFRAKFYNENIEDEKYLLNAIRYVHNNPVKANIVSHPSQYRWSSYNEYFKREKYVDRSIFLEYFPIDECKFDSAQVLKVKNNSDELFFRSTEYAVECMKEYTGLKNLYEIYKLPVEKRNKLVVYLRKEKRISCIKMAEIFNVSPKYISEILAKEKNDRGKNTGKTGVKWRGKNNTLIVTKKICCDNMFSEVLL